MQTIFDVEPCSMQIIKPRSTWFNHVDRTKVQDLFKKIAHAKGFAPGPGAGTPTQNLKFECVLSNWIIFDNLVYGKDA